MARAIVCLLNTGLIPAARFALQRLVISPHTQRNRKTLLLLQNVSIGCAILLVGLRCGRKMQINNVTERAAKRIQLLLGRFRREVSLLL